MSLVSGFGQCSFSGPPSAESVSNKPVVQAGDLTPRCNAHGSAGKVQYAIVTFVSSLLGACSPITVFRRVVATIVAPLYRVICRRSDAHVNIERIKRGPAVTVFYTPTAVTMVARVVYIAASGFHTHPGFVRRCSIHSVRSLMVRFYIGFSHWSTPSRLVIRGGVLKHPVPAILTQAV